MAFEDYLAAGVHIGMKQQTKEMRRFVYKVRPDGLAVMNVALIDERIKTAAKFLSRFEKIMVVARKPTAHRAVSKFAQVVGAKAVVGRFLPGTLTNPAFEGYLEPDVLVVTDPFIDRQAISEAVKMHIPIIALCDTFNEASFIDFIIPCNNKGRKALAFVYLMLAKELLKLRGSEAELKLEDFKAPKEST